ncbi:hypothetical protein KFE98_07555 [bacterium SCSIO 12741]|nr:hypothetical protein KFE98_07555 [bacterium SCSIO 12741]
MTLLAWSLLYLSLVPLLLYLVDGYYQNDLKKGLYHILAFIGLGILALTAISWFPVYSILGIPILLALAIFIRHITR